MLKAYLIRHEVTKPVKNENAEKLGSKIVTPGLVKDFILLGRSTGYKKLG